MKLMTKELEAAFKRQRETVELRPNGQDDLVLAKFFDPCGQWTWYATEFDGEDTLFGIVNGFEVELGYFSLSELQSVRNRLGLGIERDLYWKPRRLSEVRAELEEDAVA
jgi:hypothetical protein